MTFVLVSTVYAVAIGEPSFGVMGPFAVGLALFAMVFAGKYCCVSNGASLRSDVCSNMLDVVMQSSSETDCSGCPASSMPICSMY